MKEGQLSIVAIKDANVVIDLVEAGLFRAWFSLGIRTVTTDIVVEELKKGAQWLHVQPMIEEGLLGVESFSMEDMALSINLGKTHGVSVADASVLHLSQKLGAVLLTGDRRLRSSSESLGLRVHGVLWIMDTLLERKMIERSQAIAGLHLLLAAGARLPKKEVDVRLVSWGS